MNNGSTLVSCTLAALAGLCFVTGIALLSNEGSDVNHGTCEEIHHDA